jgi:hypothetical protein
MKTSEDSNSRASRTLYFIVATYLECGGKRSATPLWINPTSDASRQSKAPPQSAHSKNSKFHLSITSLISTGSSAGGASPI